MRETAAPAGSFAAAVIASLAVSLASCSTPAVKPPAAQPPPRAQPTAVIPVFDTDAEKIVHVFNWKEYMDPAVLDAFSRETGIEVDYDDLASNDQLDAKLRAGHSGYDVVFPSGKFLQAQIQLGLYQPLDKSRLTNLGNIDPDIAAKLALFDPGNTHAVDYTFGTTGIAYNVDRVAAIMPNAPLDSLAMIWDPKVVSRFARCGVAVLDAPSEVVGTVLMYLGKDANSEKPEDLAAAEKVMMAARPYIRVIKSNYVDELIAGEICVGLNWTGDTLQTKSKINTEGKSIQIGYGLPREGAMVYLDTMAIPADSSHVKNAHLFIDYLLRTEVAGRNSFFVGLPNGTRFSWLLTGHETLDDRNFAPPPAMRAKLAPDLPESEEFAQQLDRTWARFQAGGKRR